MSYFNYIVEKVQNQWYDKKLLHGVLNCTENDLIILPEHIKVHDELDGYAKDSVDYIVHRLNSEGRHKKIIFFLPSEGFCVSYMEYMQKVVVPLLTEHDVPIKNLYYVTGTADLAYNRMLYYKYCIKMNYIPIQTIYYNPFEGGAAMDAKTRELYHSTGPERKKKILFFNRQPRAHRLAAVAELMNKGLRSQTYLSFAIDPQRANNFSHVKLLLPKTINTTTHFIRKLLPEMPINLTLTEDAGNIFQLLETDMMVFRNSLFSIVAETLFHHSVDYTNRDVQSALHCFPCTFLTEKTWKTIRAKHPFVLLTTPYALRGLREMGYQTFHPYIDESYDNIEDDQLRFEAVMNEVERLANMDDNQTRIWLENIQPIVKNNYNVLCSKDYFMHLY